MSRYDPYSNAIAFQFDNGDIALDRVPQKFGQTESYSAIHTVKSGETIQGIAHKYYGDSGKWVDIADFNSIYNPFTELYDGLKLYIP